MQGGAATDSLDPAAWASQVPYFFGRQWGEQLVQMSPEGDVKPALAEEWGASDDAKVWTFKIRKGVQFHNGKEMSPADVVATMERHSDENSKSGALGIMGGIASVKADGQNVVFTLKDAERRPALPARRLPSDDPAERRQGQSDRRHRHRSLQGHRQRGRCAPGRREVRQLLARRSRLCRSDRDHHHQRCDGAHLGPAGRPGRHDQPHRAEDRGPHQARAGRHHPERRGQGPLRLHRPLQHRAVRQQRPAGSR